MMTRLSGSYFFFMSLLVAVLSEVGVCRETGYTPSKQAVLKLNKLGGSCDASEGHVPSYTPLHTDTSALTKPYKPPQVLPSNSEP